ncbi:DUF4253 domain-containing protein [Streptomyces sp. NPDC048142]|uniref:DUF4253 domain-containing protein n=1 Tax=Streptomyces sp. NPDC048142 TaxID=3365501 RepID=UPI00371CB764
MTTDTNNLPRLAADPSGRGLGLDLPAGRLLQETYQGLWGHPLMWLADARVVPGQWSAQRAVRRAAGLMPVLVDVGGPLGDPEGWDLMCGNLSDPEQLGDEEMLEILWEEIQEERPEGKAAPFDTPWPGLAGAVPPGADPDAQAAELADALSGSDSWLMEPRLALVPSVLNADIPAAIGWTGSLSHVDDPGIISAVLRSWGERFGTRLVALTSDRIVLSVAAPPTTVEHAAAVAVEHVALCPDGLARSRHGSLEDYAAHEILGRRTWVHHWD